MASSISNEAEITKAALSKDGESTTKSTPPTLHRAVADLAIAYMEEMRDDVTESHREAPEDNIETTSSAIVDLNIQEIISNVAKSHSLSSSSYITPAGSKASSASRASKVAASKASSTQELSFPSQAVSNPTNDEIISRFGSIMVSGTNDTESISELGTMMEARGVMSSLKTELMSWTETGCCISPSSMRAGKSCISRFDDIEMSCDEGDEEVIDIDVVKTDSAEGCKNGADDDVEENVVEDDASVQDDSSVEEEEEEEEAAVPPNAVSNEIQVVDEFKTSASVGSETNIFKTSISVETDLTEPTKNSEQSEAVAAKASASVVIEPKSTPDSSVGVEKNQKDAVESVDTASAASKSGEFEFPEEAVTTPASSGESGKDMARCASPSIDTEGSVTSAEVAALLAAIKNESVDSVIEEELAAINNDLVGKDRSLEDEVRCTSPSIDTEGSITSAQVGAILEAIRKESPVPPCPSECCSVVSKASVKSEASAAVQKIEVTAEEKTGNLEAGAAGEESVFISEQSPCEETAIDVAASNELETTSASVIKELTSVKTSESASSGITRKSNMSSLNSTPKDTKIVENCNRKLKEEGWSRSLDDLTTGLVAKIKKDWQYIESSSLIAVTGACFRDSTLATPSPIPKGEADVDTEIGQNGGDITVEKGEVVSRAHEEQRDSPKQSAAETKSAPVEQVIAPMSPTTRSRNAAETEHLHEDVYKERDFLREWKLDAEETMKCQDAVTRVLREQKLTLVKQCNDLERAIMDLKEWKFDASDEMQCQSTQLNDLMSQKAELVKQCELHQESIQELSNWKFAAEDALSIREAELKQVKVENSTLSAECSKQREALKDLNSLVSKCDDQQISLDKLNRWKMNAEEEMKQQLAKLDAFQKQISELTAHSSGQEQSTSQLAKWKADAEVTIKNQIKTIEELTQWKVSATEHANELSCKMDSFQTENRDLIKKCEDYETTIEELRASNVAAQEEQKNQLAEIERLKGEIKAGLNDEERTVIEELTKWKDEAKKTMKEKETELNELQSHYLIFGKQCNEQKELLQRREDEIHSLAKEIHNATEKISRQEKDASKQAKKIKSYEDTIQSKTDEVAELKDEIAKLKDRLENQDQPHKQELVAMKMGHHKELMVLKTEKHMLASKIEKLAKKNEDLSSRVTNLNVEMGKLESKYQHEKEGHYQSKTAVKTLEKALKSSEKKRKQMEKKLASDADFCDILSQRLNEGL